MGNVTADEFADRVNAARARMRFICGEIIQRVREASDSSGIGDILQLAREAARLAFELGFYKPPYQHLEYVRDPDPNAPNPETAENFVNGFVESPIGEGVIKLQHPDWIYAWGFRVFDPTEQTRFDAIVHALSDADVPDRPRVFPVNVAGDKIGSYRQRVERTMERWIRILDMPPRLEVIEIGRQAILSPNDNRGNASVVNVDDPVTLSDLSLINRRPKAETIQNKIRKLKNTALAFPLPVIAEPGKAQVWSYAAIRPFMQREWPEISWPEYDEVRNILRGFGAEKAEQKAAKKDAKDCKSRLLNGSLAVQLAGVPVQPPTNPPRTPNKPLP